MSEAHEQLAVIGAGNIGLAITRGLVQAGLLDSSSICLTRRRLENLQPIAKEGFRVTSNNLEALEFADLIMLCVEPQHVDGVFEEIGSKLDPDRHTLISIVSGLQIGDIRKRVHPEVHVVRAMPNTATDIRQSMTCLASDPKSGGGIQKAERLFQALGSCLVIQEEKMSSATALAACGIAFFMRMIRAASQGGTEIGFHPETALRMAAQTAKGAASLILEHGSHPEFEIDRVTTPRGCTIAGLNQMEHEGLSSAIIKGIITSSNKASGLYRPD